MLVSSEMSFTPCLGGGLVGLGADTYFVLFTERPKC
jgi:hypothetical protein